ncbi:MAG: DUF4350 domain-containing protein [Elainellaceae cyanobacterium]
MTISRRWYWIGAAIALVIGVLSFLPPTNSTAVQGSTFSRAPDGYGAWYAYMQERGASIQRWQRPPEALPEALSEALDSTVKQPITMLQIVPPSLTPAYDQWTDWIASGNTVIVLTGQQSVTAAPFSSLLTSGSGPVRIETRRRYEQLANDETALLADSHGAVVWRSPIGSGALIQATTPYLGANAYQEAPGNFAFLASLATGGSTTNATVWVDEYLHGYRDLETEDPLPTQRSWATYLAQTPLLIILVQAIALGLLLMWGQRRLGPPTALPQSAQNNSEAYITALATVLRRAKSTGFVIETVTKAEKRWLQQALGLGRAPVDDATLVKAWVQQTQRPAADLQRLLEFGQRPASAPNVLVWLKVLQSVRHFNLNDSP